MTRLADRLGSPAARRTAGLLFLVLFTLFTWKLLQPQPVPPAIQGELHAIFPGLLFLLAKLAHLLGYAVLVLLGGTVLRSQLGRVLLIVVLLLHAIGTELGQSFIPNRTGTIRDVIIDLLGIALGAIILTWIIPTPESRLP